MGRTVNTHSGARLLALSACLTLAIACDQHPLLDAIKKLDASLTAPVIELTTETDAAVASGGSEPFGDCPEDSGKTRAFRIWNTGKGNLHLTADPLVDVTGTGEFSVTEQPSAAIAPGTYSEFTVRFAPTSVGNQAAQIVLECDDPDSPVFSFTVTGTGTATPMPEIVVKQNTTPIAYAATYDMGTVLLNTPTLIDFTILNTGDANLILDGNPRVKVSGTQASLFELTVPPASQVVVSGSTTFTIEFTATSSGLKSVTVEIDSNDSVHPAFQFTLQGTGQVVLVPDINVKRGATSISSGGSWPFLNCTTNTPVELSFTIESNGTADLNLTSNPRVGVGGFDPTMFSVISQPDSPISSGSTAAFTVRFTPTSTGGKSASLSIDSNDPDTATYTINISGTGTAPSIKLPDTGQLTSYATRDDGALRMGAAWPGSRFTSATSTVTDTLTGLMWVKDQNLMKTRDPAFDLDSTANDGMVTWQHALDYLGKLNTEVYGSYSDWRLPNFLELSSLLNLEQSDSRAWLVTQGFSNAATGTQYWSSTTYAAGPSAARLVNMQNGGSWYQQKDAGYWYVFPVRSHTTGTVSLPKTGQTATYATGDDGSLQKGTAWPAARFTVTGGMITDNLTGLVWENSPSITPLAWTAALSSAASLNVGGYADWRLPNKAELASLVNHGQTSSATWLNSQGFSNIQESYYWTSTSSPFTPVSNGCGVDLSYGSNGTLSKTQSWYVLCVRSGD